MVGNCLYENGTKVSFAIKFLQSSFTVCYTQQSFVYKSLVNSLMEIID